MAFPQPVGAASSSGGTMGPKKNLPTVNDDRDEYNEIFQLGKIKKRREAEEGKIFVCMPSSQSINQLTAESFRSVCRSYILGFSSLLPAGDRIYGYSRQMWYKARIMGVHQAAHPHEPARGVPCYQIHYDGWASKSV